MADPTFFELFETPWAEAGTVDVVTLPQYRAGWAYIGSLPPTVEQFNKIQQLNDQKLAWLFRQVKEVAAATGQVVGPDTLDILIHALQNLDMDKATAGLLPVTRGGTGLGAIPPGNFLVGDLAGQMKTLTPKQTLDSIGGAPLDSPQFSGQPLAPTPPSGNNTTRLATTAFVRSAVTESQRGLSALGVKVVQSSQTLAVADLGHTVILNATSGSLTATLPSAASAFRGARFEFINNGAIGASVVKQGSDNVLNTDGSLAAAGASVPVGAFLTLECVDAATWTIVNSSAPAASTSTAGVLRVASTLQAQQMTDDGVAITPKKLKDAFLGANQQLTTSGFQKMPGGTIEQWLRVPHTLGMGVSQSYTFPFAFPNATLGVSIVDISAPNSGAVVWAASQIAASWLSMFWNYSNVTGGTSSREVFVRAIGW